MKGKYINTVIMQAALAGNRSRRLAAQKETLTTLDNHKVFWSKNGTTKTTVINQSKTVVLD